MWATAGTSMLVAVMVAACSANSGSRIEGDDDGTSGPGSGGGLNTGGGFTVGAGGSDGCPATCSADLKSVIDCNGAVVEQCGTDQACLAGGCGGDPCGAADEAKSSYGCDYWALKPDMITDGFGACFATYVANTWDVPVHITVERQGQDLGTGFIYIPQGQGQGLSYAPYDPQQGLPVGEVALVFLSHQNGGLPDCPGNVAVNGESAVAGTAIGNAFNVKTDRPVVAYTIMPYGGGPSAATSATLLLPTSAWDTNYIAVNAYAKSQIVAQAAPSLDILAFEDNTQVTLLPKVAVQGGGGVAGSAANTPVVYTLNRGQYVQITQVEELTGSPIQSDKPVGVWGGASCLNVPVTAAACDSAHQQIPPIPALGSEYAGVRYRNRSSASGEEAPPWRLVGAVDGTQLTWTPSAPPGAPTTMNQGDVFEFMHSGPFVVSSQDEDHPFYAAQYMTGADYIGTLSGEGDPEWVNIIPTAQYLDDYVFFTDPTYSETSLVIVRKPSSVDGAFKEVNLDCAGTLGGWQPLGPYEYTRVDLVTGNFQSVNGCSNGRHEITSDAPFGVTVWGWGSFAAVNTTYVSYAYPAGASIQPINEVVVPPTPK